MPGRLSQVTPELAVWQIEPMEVELNFFQENSFTLSPRFKLVSFHMGSPHMSQLSNDSVIPPGLTFSLASFL